MDQAIAAEAAAQYDPIELEILWKRLISVVDEASAAFVRTCFSTLVRDGNDFAIVLTDASGHSLAQSAMSLPPLPLALRLCLRHFFPCPDPRARSDSRFLLMEKPRLCRGIPRLLRAMCLLDLEATRPALRPCRPSGAQAFIAASRPAP